MIIEGTELWSAVRFETIDNLYDNLIECKFDSRLLVHCIKLLVGVERKRLLVETQSAFLGTEQVRTSSILLDTNSTQVVKQMFRSLEPSESKGENGRRRIV